MTFAATLSYSSLLLSGCELPGLNVKPNADGTYKGDFQVRAYVYERVGVSSVRLVDRTITGAVGFTIQGDKVITTPSAGEGIVTWDQFNRTMWVDFVSIASSNESGCLRWEYSGGLLEDDQFLTGEGTISCIAPTDDFSSFAPFPQTYWKVRRQ